MAGSQIAARFPSKVGREDGFSMCYHADIVKHLQPFDAVAFRPDPTTVV
jgi:hypothetical protein